MKPNLVECNARALPAILSFESKEKKVSSKKKWGETLKKCTQPFSYEHISTCCAIDCFQRLQPDRMSLAFKYQEVEYSLSPMMQKPTLVIWGLRTVPVITRCHSPWSYQLKGGKSIEMKVALGSYISQMVISSTTLLPLEPPFPQEKRIELEAGEKCKGLEHVLCKSCVIPITVWPLSTIRCGPGDPNTTDPK